MAMPVPGRRRFLAATALSGAAALLTPRIAASLQLIEGDAARERLYLQACEARSIHEQLAEQVRAQLRGQDERARAEAIVRAMKCPFCGCALVEPAQDAASPR